jgi:hypothetical protein
VVKPAKGVRLVLAVAEKGFVDKLGDRLQDVCRGTVVAAGFGAKQHHPVGAYSKADEAGKVDS